MYQSMFSRDIFSDLLRLQREMQRLFEPETSIRGLGGGGFPALNVGGTPQAVELYAFAPGLDPASIDVNLERGILTISGDRATERPPEAAGITQVIGERFAGRFRRAVSLTDDIDPDKVSAEYRDGVLHIRLQRLAPSTPRRIAVQ